MTAEFWNRRASKYDARVRDGDYRRTLESTLQFIGDGDAVLDVGCGSGEYSLDLAPKVLTVHGIDTSTKMIDLALEKARKAAVANVQFSAKDVLDRQLDGTSYSAIVALNVLHLVDDVGDSLRRVRCLPGKQNVTHVASRWPLG